MRGKLTKILGGVLALTMMFSGTAVFAANYAAIPGTTTSLTKYMVVEQDAEIPDVEFTFEVSAGNAVEATAGTVKTWAGLNPELVKVNGTAQEGVTTFTAGEAATAGALDGVATAEQKYATKTIALDFSGVNYAEPGVYRYLLTETASTNSAVQMDSKPVRTIDVYVEDVNGSLQVTGYVSYEGTVTDAAKTLPTIDMTEWETANPEPTFADAENPTPEETQAHDTWEAAREAEIARQTALTPNGAEASTPKSDKYVNTLDSADLTISKTVTGNQGSKDQYFEFTVTVNNAGANAVMTLDMAGAETETHENTATTFAKTAMDEANQKDDDKAAEAVLYTAEDAEVIAGEAQVGDVKTPAREGKAGQQVIADASGSATFKVYLHHGQQAVLKGLPKNATYTVEETAAAGYTTTKTGDTGTIVNDDVTAAFTNNREGVIPTGVATAIAGGAGIVAVAVIGSIASKRRKDEE